MDFNCGDRDDNSCNDRNEESNFDKLLSPPAVLGLMLTDQ